MSGWPILIGAVLLASLWRLSDLSMQPAAVVTWAALFCFGSWIFREDRWLGAFVLYMQVRALISREVLSFETAILLTFGAGLLIVARSIPPTRRGLVRGLLVGAGLLQLAFVGLQWWWLPPDEWTAGSLGNPNYLGALLAILAGVAPGSFLPLFGIGIVASRSWLAALAFAAMLGVRYRLAGPWIAIGATTTIALTLWQRGPALESFWHRLAVWKIGLADLLAHPLSLLMGWGPGAWLRRIPGLQRNSGYPFREIFGEAHNEIVQLLYEGGLLALIFVGLWVWRHRQRLIRSPETGSLAALAMVSLGMFPFHVAALAIVAVTLLGLATSAQPVEE